MNSIAEQKQSVLKVILSCVSAEIIYELGFQSSDYKTTSIFAFSAMSHTELTHYYLLVLIPKGESLKPHEVQDKIENSCRAIVPVTALVMFFEDFRKLVVLEHRFALLVITNACSVYTKSSSAHIPQVENVPGQLIESGEIWTKEYNKVNELLKGAEFYLEHKQVHMALFMAHHAAIALLRYVFRKSTGLFLQTHNFDKLIRYCSMLENMIFHFFPNTTDEDKRLYRMIHYIDSYKNINTKYRAVYKDIELLISRIDKVKGLIQ